MRAADQRRNGDLVADDDCSELGNYEMNNHVVEYEQDRRIGREPGAGRGHPNAAWGGPESPRWGHHPWLDDAAWFTSAVAAFWFTSAVAAFLDGR
jgi:hypothetical protein